MNQNKPNKREVQIATLIFVLVGGLIFIPTYLIFNDIGIIGTAAMGVVNGGVAGKFITSAVSGAKGGGIQASQITSAKTISAFESTKNLQKIQSIQPFSINLQSGNIREYGPLRVSKTPGPTIGARIVKEINQNDGKTIRVWNENYDNLGRVTQIHPKYPKDLGHLRIDPILRRIIEWLP